MAVLTNMLMASPLPCPGCDYVGTTKPGTCKKGYKIQSGNEECCSPGTTVNGKFNQCCHKAGDLDGRVACS